MDSLESTTSPVTPTPDGAPPRDTPKHFRRLAMIVAGGLGVLVLVTGGAFLFAYAQAKAMPPEYEAVVEVPADTVEENRRALESQLTTLYSDTQTLPEWRSTITAGQINAWLATRLPAEFPRVARAGFTDPRVMIDGQNVTLAMRGAVGRIRGVLSLALRPFVTETGELALELESARLGNFLLPMEAVVAKLRAARVDRLAPVRWSQTESRTVLLVDLDRVADSDERDLRLTGVDLRVDELLIRGESAAVDADTEIDPDGL